MSEPCRGIGYESSANIHAPTMVIVIEDLRSSEEVQPSQNLECQASRLTFQTKLWKFSEYLTRSEAAERCSWRHIVPHHGEMRRFHDALPFRSALGSPWLLCTPTRASSTNAGRGLSPVLSHESDEVKVKVKVGLSGFVRLRYSHHSLCLTPVALTGSLVSAIHPSLHLMALSSFSSDAVIPTSQGPNT